jgi:hypothetical protein
MAANEENLKRLEAAGLDLSRVPDSHRDVLAELSPEEINTMLRIRERLEAAGAGDVQGYRAGDTGVFYY